ILLPSVDFRFLVPTLCLFPNPRRILVLHGIGAAVPIRSTSITPPGRCLATGFFQALPQTLRPLRGRRTNGFRFFPLGARRAAPTSAARTDSIDSAIPGSVGRCGPLRFLLLERLAQPLFRRPLTLQGFLTPSFHVRSDIAWRNRSRPDVGRGP